MPTNKENNGAKVSEQMIAISKQVEEKSKLSYHTLLDILGSIQEALYVIDSDWNIIYLNKITAAVIGKEPEDLVGRNFWETYPNDVGTIMEKEYRAAMKNKEVSKFEMHSYYGDTWYEVMVFPMANGITILGTNITERKKAEEALKQSEERFSKAFNNSPIAVIITSYEGGCYIDVNETFLGLFEYNREEVIGKTSFEINIFANPNGRSEFLRNLKTDGRIHDLEMTFRTKTGKLVKTIISSEKITLNGQEDILTTLVDITERKKDEKALQDSEEHYRGLFNNIEDGFELFQVIYDNAGAPCNLRYLEVNASYEKQSGASATKVVGKIITDVFPNIEHIWIEKFGKVAQTGESTSFEDYNQPTNRLYHAYAFCFAENQVGVLFKDITEQRKTEEALKESEERFRIAMKNAPVSVAAQDCDLRYIWAYNQRTARPDQIIGKLDSDIFTPQEAKHLNLIKRRILKENVELREQSWYERPSGKIFLDLTLSPLHDKKGQLIGVASATVDLTKTKLAEESMERQASLIDLSPDAIIVKNLDDVIIFWSKGAEWLYGWKKEEVIGKESRQLFKTTFPEPYEEILSQLQSKGRWNGEKIHTAKDGRQIIVYSRWLVKRNDDGQITEILETNEDITDRKKAEEALRQRTEQLESTQKKLEENAVQLEEYASQMEELAEQRANQLKDSERLATIGITAGMVGHDIRNPLQAITGDVYLAKTDLASIPESEKKQTIQESLTEIEKNIDYINKIVADLQDFARPLKPNAEETDIKPVIDQLLAKNGLPENVKVSVKVESGARLFVADSTFINRIMYNLVNNAVQAMPKGGQLTIHAYKEAKDVVISVKDTGVGIPEAVKSKLFTPMFTTKAKGQGFGLPVIKRMTEALGGTVTFVSQEGKGTTFIVRLPPQRAKR